MGQQVIREEETEAAPKMEHQSKRCIVYRTLVEKSVQIKKHKRSLNQTSTNCTFLSIAHSRLSMRSHLKYIIITISKEE